MRAFLRLAVVAAAIALSGCASTVRYAEPSTGNATLHIPVESASRVVLNLQLDAPHPQDADWQTFAKEWHAIMDEQAAASNVASAAQDGPATPTGAPGTLVVVHVHDYHYVTVGKRIMLGIMTGNAYIDAQVEYRDLATGALFGERSYNTSSSAWHGVFGAMTPKQLYSIADETLAQMALR